MKCMGCEIILRNLKACACKLVLRKVCDILKLADVLQQGHYSSLWESQPEVKCLMNTDANIYN